VALLVMVAAFLVCGGAVYKTWVRDRDWAQAPASKSAIELTRYRVMVAIPVKDVQGRRR
jgi:archaellum component FlaF (FlaF/FlaG flagellin family)